MDKIIGMLREADVALAQRRKSIRFAMSLPELDSVVIGPWDLSGAIGTLGEVTSPRLMEAARRGASAARSAGISVGAGMGALPEFARTMVQLGVQWLQYGGDSGFLASAADHAVAGLRSLLGAERLAARKEKS